MKFTPVVLTALVAASAVSAPPVLTDGELLDRVEAQSCRYASTFTYKTAATAQFPDGRSMIADSSTSGNVCSVAATGMGLVCLAIQAERYGTTSEWTVTPAQARSKANSIMDAVLDMQSGGTDQQWAGVPYHFVKPRTNGSWGVASGEVSSVDGALLVEGVLAAGKAFGGELHTKALQIARNIDWSKWLLNSSDGPRYSMAWSPTSGGDFTIPAPGGGYLMPWTYDRPTDEVLLLPIVGLANDPRNADLLRSQYGYPRVTRSYRGSNGVTYRVVNSYFGSLFTYTQSHGMIPFDRLGPDHPEDVGSTKPAVNWWDNSVVAALAARQYCADHAIGKTPADGYATHASFGINSWGLTSCADPAGGYKGPLGGLPREANGGAPEPDGIIAPHGAISCIRLLRMDTHEMLADNWAFNALRHYYDTRYDTLWGTYGPKDAFNDAGQVANVWIGIDTPLQAINIEDYRTGKPAQWFTMNAPIADALAVIYHTGLNPGDMNLDGASDVTDAADILKIAAGISVPTPHQRYNGDLDGDGALTITDAALVFKP